VIALPTLPEDYFWKVDFNQSGDIEIEVRRSLDDDYFYGREDLAAYEVVRNNISHRENLDNKVQFAIDELYEKITRGVAILTQLE